MCRIKSIYVIRTAVIQSHCSAIITFASQTRLPASAQCSVQIARFLTENSLQCQHECKLYHFLLLESAFTASTNNWIETSGLLWSIQDYTKWPAGVASPFVTEGRNCSFPDCSSLDCSSLDCSSPDCSSLDCRPGTTFV